MIRLASNLIIVFVIAVLPWWLASILLVGFLVLFDFVEIIFYGIILDFLYAVPGSFLSAHGFLTSALVVYALSVIVRPYFKAV
jgi:hypothetical protein